jgi:hypothetical protein
MNPNWLALIKNRLCYELLRIPASSIIGIVRVNVGMNVLPPWHFIVLAVPFFAAFGLTRIYGFLWCGLFIAGGLLVHGSCWLTQHFKDEPIDPDSEGMSADGEADSDWRQFGEPIMAICGAGVAFYYHQWILGSWILFAAFCLTVVAQLQIVDEEIQLSDTSFLAEEPPELTKPRIVAAFAVAAIVDLIQMPLTAFEFTGWIFFGEIADGVLDTITMGVTTVLLGFHWALLPSFMVEAVPGLDALPTWTGCVAFVVWQRKKEDSLFDGVDIDDDDDDDDVVSPAQTPPPDAAVERRLQRLMELREKNVISQAEYEAKRQQIISEL